MPPSSHGFASADSDKLMINTAMKRGRKAFILILYKGLLHEYGDARLTHFFALFFGGLHKLIW